MVENVLKTPKDYTLICSSLKIKHISVCGQYRSQQVILGYIIIIAKGGGT